jgi:phosphate transport system protein
MTIKRHFDTELNDLKTRLVEMAELVQKMITASVASLATYDTKSSEEVFAMEKEVNIAEIVIDDKCLKLIALNQPVGTDLRFITSAMRVSTDLERMADYAVNVTEIAQELLEFPETKPLSEIPKMANIVQDMIKSSTKAFNTNNVDLAEKVLEQDDEVDVFHDKAVKKIAEIMTNSSSHVVIQRAIRQLVIVRSLERMGDHATNIGEDIIFMVNGKDIRHSKLSRPEKQRIKKENK